MRNLIDESDSSCHDVNRSLHLCSGGEGRLLRITQQADEEKRGIYFVTKCYKNKLYKKRPDSPRTKER